MTYSPFDVARNIGNNLAGAFREAREENAIEQILSGAMETDDPNVLQQSIGKILSQVSPERQGPAIQYLQNTMQQIEAKKRQEQQIRSAKAGGYDPYAPSAVQAAQFKEREKNKRLSQFGLGQNVEPTLGSVFNKLSDDQLVLATGSPDREVAEPAKAELDRRQAERKLDQQKDTDIFKSDLARSSKLIDRADQLAETIPQKETALNLMDDALANKDMSFFSGDNLAEITGIEGLRSKEGAIFKTAGKEYFLGNIERAGVRPNQWIEQQIADMLAKIGRSTAANLSVVRALRNELSLDKERVRKTNQLSDQLILEGDRGRSKLSPMLNKHMQEFAQKQQKSLFNDLRAIKAIDEKKPQKFMTVEKGTPISEYMAQALLQQFGNDPKQAEAEAKKLGYEIE